jgi:hypothetical protein
MRNEHERSGVPGGWERRQRLSLPQAGEAAGALTLRIDASVPRRSEASPR